MESDTTQKEHSSPLENVLLKLLVIVFCGAIVGIIGVALFRLFSHTSSPSTALLTPLSQETPTPIPTQPITTTLQQTLSRACTSGNSEKNTYLLSVELLPISIQSSVISLATDSKKTMCKGTESEKYVVLTTKDGFTLYLYDTHISQLDTFGNSLMHPSLYTQTIDNSISTQGDISLTMFLQETPDTTIGEIPVIVRATKQLHLTTGETIFISADSLIISGDDPPLIQVLSLFAIPSAKHPGRKDIDPTRESDAVTAVKNAFFSSLNSLSLAQLHTIITLQTQLQAISAK